MRRKLRLLAASATLLLVLVAIGLFAFRIGQIKSSGERSSEAEYSILRNALVSIQSRTEIDGELLRGRLLALYQGSDRLLAAQVLDESGLVLWKVPAKSRYFALPNETAARSGYASPRFSTIIQATPLSDGMRLTALYTSFRRSDISKAALPSFVMLLVWFVALAIATFFLRKDPGEAAGSKGIDVPALETEESPAEAPTAPLSEAGSRSQEISPAETVDGGEETAEEIAAEDKGLGTVEDLDETEEPGEVLGEPAEEGSAADLGSSWLSPSIKRDSSGRNFEESLARLEEEVREWSSRKTASPSQPSSPVRPEAPVSPSEHDASELADESMEDEIDEELDEVDAMEAGEGERPLPDEAPVQENTEFDAEELLKEFEELSAEDKAAVPPLPPRPAEPSPETGKRDLSSLSLPLTLQNPDLEARLSEGLGRSAADIALIIVHCGLLSDSDPAAPALAVTLRDYIGASDLVFELYKGAFAVILPSVDLGAALKMSEDLADVLAATYSLYRDLEEEAPVYIGISARSGRTVDAFKLYREASTAVHKAYSGGPSKILAFRPKAE